MVINPEDEEAFKRMLTTQKRSGDTCLKIFELAQQNNPWKIISETRYTGISTQDY
jgi:hypothetical protein